MYNQFEKFIEIFSPYCGIIFYAFYRQLAFSLSGIIKDWQMERKPI